MWRHYIGCNDNYSQQTLAQHKSKMIVISIHLYRINFLTLLLLTYFAVDIYIKKNNNFTKKHKMHSCIENYFIFSNLFYEQLILGTFILIAKFLKHNADRGKKMWCTEWNTVIKALFFLKFSFMGSIKFVMNIKSLENIYMKKNYLSACIALKKR